eukprot:scaffold8701_cov28-Tisochrysis_lutea.AAC.2
MPRRICLLFSGKEFVSLDPPKVPYVSWHQGYRLALIQLAFTNSSSSNSLPVFTSCSDISSRHCGGILYLSRSDGRTPSHLISIKAGDQAGGSGVRLRPKRMPRLLKGGIAG